MTQSDLQLLPPELQVCHRQFAAIKDDAEALVRGLTDEELTWSENPSKWSIADCLNHLAVTGNQSLSNIRAAIEDARSRGLFGSAPFRHPLLGNWLIRLMDAPPTVKFKAPRAYRPMAGSSVAEILSAFFLLQDELMRALHEADRIDLARVKVSNPVNRWFKLSLGQEFALTAAHERRHLWQGSLVRERRVSSITNGD